MPLFIIAAPVGASKKDGFVDGGSETFGRHANWGNNLSDQDFALECHAIFDQLRRQGRQHVWTLADIVSVSGH